MTSLLTLSGKDYGGESTSVGLRLTDVTAANYDAHITSIGLLQTAVNGVTLGAFSGVKFSAIATPAGAKSADPNGQRESKWLVTYVDSVNPVGNGSFEIGMADRDQLVVDGNTLNVGVGTPGEDLVDAIETHVVSRLGNAITVESIRLVGRNT